jgi:type IV pilus assembly protein PilQ
VPYLGDIPVLGTLFKTTDHTDDKDELMIFITPKIVREGVNVYN